jgi:hypothetical protein
MLRPEYLAQKLAPYSLPTKDGGVLRTPQQRDRVLWLRRGVWRFHAKAI